MTSSIVRTNPTAGTATTASVRDNFGFAADEITALQRANVDIVSTTGGPVAYSASYAGSPTFSYSDGVRVIARINTTNTTTAPTLTISPVATAVPIKKADGSDVSIGDLVSGGTYEFVYNASSAEFDCLNLPGNTVTITGDQTITGSKTFTDGLTVSSSSPSPSISIQDTDASGAFVISQYNSGDGVFTIDSAETFRVKSTGIDVTGTVLVSGDGTSGNDPDLFLRNTETAADGNITGQLLFQGKQETSSDYASYSYIVTKAVDVTDATKEGEMNFHVRDGASESPVERLSITKDGIDVTGTVTADGVELGNNERITLGSESGGQLEIYEATGGNGVIEQTGTGDIVIKGENGSLRNDANDAVISWFPTYAALDYRGATGAGTKLETTSTGVDVTGTITCGKIESNLTSGTFEIENTHAGSVRLTSSAGETRFVLTDSQVQLWYGSSPSDTGSSKLSTTTTGVNVTGTVKATGYIEPDTGYKSADGTIGFTGSASASATLTIKNGLIVAVS